MIGVGRRPNIKALSRPELELEGKRQALEVPPGRPGAVATWFEALSRFELEGKRLPFARTMESLVARPSTITARALGVISPFELWLALLCCARDTAFGAPSPRELRALKLKAQAARQQHLQLVRAYDRAVPVDIATAVERDEQRLRFIAARHAYEYRRAHDHARAVDKGTAKHDRRTNAVGRARLAALLQWTRADVERLIDASDHDWTDRPCSSVTSRLAK